MPRTIYIKNPRDGSHFRTIEGPGGSPRPPSKPPLKKFQVVNLLDNLGTGTFIAGVTDAFGNPLGAYQNIHDWTSGMGFNPPKPPQMNFNNVLTTFEEVHYELFTPIGPAMIEISPGAVLLGVGLIIVVTLLVPPASFATMAGTASGGVVLQGGLLGGAAGLGTLAGTGQDFYYIGEAQGTPRPDYSSPYTVNPFTGERN